MSNHSLQRKNVETDEDRVIDSCFLDVALKRCDGQGFSGLYCQNFGLETNLTFDGRSEKDCLALCFPQYSAML